MARSYRDILIEARDLIVDPARWTHHRGAADAMGNSCMPLDQEACRWCATGALHHVTGSMHGRAINGPLGYLNWAARRAGYASTEELNDRDDHGLVLSMYDRAISQAARD